jgi:hypothetical protein
MIKINNLPDNFTKYPYIVARRANGELWYWGSFKSRTNANEAALSVNGITYQTEEVERGEF